MILTCDSGKFLAILLETLSNFFAEIVVGIDPKSMDGAYSVARQYASKIVPVDNPAGIVEAVLEQLASHCSNDWILRLDDDELISSGVPEFIRNYLPSLAVDAVGIHRKWCRVNLSTSSLEYATHPVYGFDWQWRLFRKSKVTFNRSVHTPGIGFGTETKAPLDGFILHLDWVYRDLQHRRNKVVRYEAMRKGAGMGHFYLYEERPSGENQFAPLYAPDLNEATQKLIPLQRAADSLTASFLAPDPGGIRVLGTPATGELSLRPREGLRLPILLENRSAHALSSSCAVNVSYHWRNAETGDCVIFDGLRTALPRFIYPGETVAVSIDVIAPDRPGRYNLNVTLVKELEYWFEEKNPAVVLEIPARVTAPEDHNQPLDNLNLLSFEIGTGCQLNNLHKECPIHRQERHPNRSHGHLTPERIARTIDQARELGFHGWAAFHYYNEPLLYMKEILQVMNLTRYEKFLLWTNGLLLAEHRSSLDRFHTIHVTDYQLPNSPDFQRLMAEHPGVNWIVRKISLDGRIELSQPIRETVTCTRPEYLELPIDYYGNIHLCCYDWRGDTHIGNILEQEFTEIIHSPAFQSILAGLKGGAGAPAICKSCRYPAQALKVFD
jgi:MoaA/NifB/PqqE/SkfB family radical SAM enzyme